MVHEKDNLNTVFKTIWNNCEIEIMKPSFESTFGNWRANPKITKYVGKYLYIQRPINVAQGAGIYA